MTAPTLERMKFWIVVPKYAENQIKNPTFASPDYAEDWTVKGASAVIAETGDEARWGVYSMQVTPVTGVDSVVYYAGLSVESGLAYTFSCYVKGIATQTMRIMITDSTGTAKATTTFTATGYWQRVEVSWTSNATATNYQVQVIRNSVASTAAFYVDGAQFEQNAVATTFFDGYTPGCHWTGAIRNSVSARSDNTGLGGELLCINDYASITKHIGFGMGQWNQIMTKMTAGGDMYQTHTRKSRTVALNLAYTGESHGELQAKRKVILDALRPDLLSNLPVTEQFGINMPGSWRGHEQRILRYQGFNASGAEATNPVDIVCVFESCHSDTPDTETSQQDTLIFTVPSGLFQGAYQEGKVLDLYADFPAEHIVKRDPQGNWCKWNGTGYDNSLKGQGTVQGLNGIVRCMAEGPDGKIYVGGNFTNAGGVAAADYIARWNPVSEEWEAVGVPNTGAASINTVSCLDFDASGNLYVGGIFTNFGDVAAADYFAKWNGTNWTALGSGIDSQVYDIEISPSGIIYICGGFETAGGDTNCNRIAYYDTGSSNWKPLATGFNNFVYSIKFLPNNNLYIGGGFTDAAYPYLCKWNGTAFSAVGTAGDIGGNVYHLNHLPSGEIVVGGEFSNAGGNPNADKIVLWNGASWKALGTGTNTGVRQTAITSDGKLYVIGSFTIAGGLTLTDRVAVWSNGAWQPLDIDLPGTAESYSVLPASDGSLYIGGDYSTTVAGENAKTGIVALNFDVASASANTYPVISITGPGTLKSIMNYRTGKSVMFDGLTLGAGEWISLNFDPLQLSFRSGWASRGNLMRYVIAGSDYGDFYVSPGANYLSLFMDDTDANSKASITYVPKFWGLDGALL